jgi:hypothetical protein
VVSVNSRNAESEVLSPNEEAQAHGWAVSLQAGVHSGEPANTLSHKTFVMGCVWVGMDPSEAERRK